MMKLAISDRQALVLDRLYQIDGALTKVERRFASISTPNDFWETETGQDMLDSICMVLGKANGQLIP